MLPKSTLTSIATARLDDAKSLLSARRYDGAMYLCGYSVEMALKASACTSLGWSEFPSKGSEFDGLSSFKTHNLVHLLRLSGRETHIKNVALADWSIIVNWSPEMRYQSTSATEQETKATIHAAEAVLRAL